MQQVFGFSICASGSAHYQTIRPADQQTSRLGHLLAQKNAPVFRELTQVNRKSSALKLVTPMIVMMSVPNVITELIMS